MRVWGSGADKAGQYRQSGCGCDAPSLTKHMPSSLSGDFFVPEPEKCKRVLPKRWTFVLPQCRSFGLAGTFRARQGVETPGWTPTSRPTDKLHKTCKGSPRPQAPLRAGAKAGEKPSGVAVEPGVGRIRRVCEAESRGPGRSVIWSMLCTLFCGAVQLLTRTGKHDDITCRGQD